MFLVLQYYTGPISEKKHLGIENFVEKCLFEKKKKITIFLVWIVCQNQLTIRAFDLHLPSGLIKCLFIKWKCPFISANNNFRGIFCFNSFNNVYRVFLGRPISAEVWVGNVGGGVGDKTRGQKSRKLKGFSTLKSLSFD